MQRQVRYSGLLTARQFSKLAKTSGVSKMKLARVRRILVGGESTQQVADSEGIRAGALYPAMQRVCRQSDAKGILANANMVFLSRFPGSMTARQFNKAAKRTRFYPVSVVRSRRVLVDGEGVQDVADGEGLSSEAIYRVIRMVCAQLDQVGR